jgi:D-alanyl-lipoteichoic acid acyltransferase DltB (MBOAT superfamily)
VFAGHAANRAVAWMLAAASLAFYSAWRLDNLPILALSVVANFFLGQQLARHRNQGLLALSIALNVLALAYFKYSGFIADNLSKILGVDVWFVSPALPLAISFFTFQQIAYLVDSYRREVGSHGFLDYLLFVTFFPHLIAGPLVQPRDMLHQWRDQDLRPTLERFAIGLTVLIVGLFKKVVLADNLAPFVDIVFARSRDGLPSFVEAAAATVGFSWQIYFDFSGYTDMAVGIAWMFGVRLPVNFASPYRAGSIIEFWQRWHMTLSRFLRDYLYVPLGGNRSGLARQSINIMIVMLIGGLWHGAAWTFVLWGAVHGAAIIVNHLWRTAAEHCRLPAIPGPIGWFATFATVLLAWILFRASSFESALNMILALAGQGTLLPGGELAPDFSNARSLLAPFLVSYGDALLIIAMGAVVIFLLPNLQSWMAATDIWIADRRVKSLSSWLKWSPRWGFACGILAAASLYCIWGTQTKPLFIYFEF